VSPKIGNRRHPLLVEPALVQEPEDPDLVDRIAMDVRRLPASLSVGRRLLLGPIGRELRNRSRVGTVRPVRGGGFAHELYCAMPDRCTC
jgi:hypothetical protein